MPERTITGDPHLAKVLEKQMRNWEIARSQSRAPCDAEQPLRDFITISNICGAGGKTLATALGERLGWPVFDRQLITEMARNDESRALLYRSMDERDLGWLENTCRAFMESSFNRNDYFRKLTETVLCVVRKSPAVLVGRSADLILPRDRGLRVKVVASPERCARNFAEYAGVSIEEARRQVVRIEQERRDFIWNHFRIDACEPTRFDLIVNLEQFEIGQVVEIVVAAFECRKAAASVAARP